MYDQQSTTQQLFQQLENSIFQGTGQESLYDLFSTINHTFLQYEITSYNHTSYYLPTSQQQHTRDLKGLLKLFLNNDQPQILLETYQEKSENWFEMTLYT